MNKLKTGGLAILLTMFSIPALAAQINVNEASKDDLLKGISGLTEKQAEAIVQYRNDHGAIVKLHELYMLGVSPDVIESNYAKLSVGGATWGDKNPDRNVDYTVN